MVSRFPSRCYCSRQPPALRQRTAHCGPSCRFELAAQGDTCMLIVFFHPIINFATCARTVEATSDVRQRHKYTRGCWTCHAVAVTMGCGTSHARDIVAREPPRASRRVSPAISSVSSEANDVVAGVPTSARAATTTTPKKPHKWISATMWAPAGSDGVGLKPSSAGESSTSARRLPPMTLDNSHHDFDQVGAGGAPAPPGPASRGSNRSTPRSHGTPARGMWHALRSPGEGSANPLTSPALPACALKFQEQKSLEAVQLRSRANSVDSAASGAGAAAAAAAAGFDASSDCSASDDSGLDDDVPRGAGRHGGGSNHRPSSPSSLLSDDMPYVQGLLYAESVSDTEDHVGGMWGRLTDSPMSHGENSDDDDEWVQLT